MVNMCCTFLGPRLGVLFCKLLFGGKTKHGINLSSSAFVKVACHSDTWGKHFTHLVLGKDQTNRYLDKNDDGPVSLYITGNYFE